MLKARAECSDDFSTGFAKCLKLGFVYSLNVFAKVIGKFGQLAFNIFAMNAGIRRRFVVRFHSAT